MLKPKMTQEKLNAIKALVGAKLNNNRIRKALKCTANTIVLAKRAEFEVGRYNELSRGFWRSINKTRNQKEVVTIEEKISSPKGMGELKLKNQLDSIINLLDGILTTNRDLFQLEKEKLEFAKAKKSWWAKV